MSEKMTNEQPDSPPRDFAETYLAGATEYSKEQRDIAFATLVLESGAVSERALSRAVSNWTIHGSTTLADHLERSGLIDSATRIPLEQQAAARLEGFSTDSDGNGAGAARGDSVLISTLKGIDPSGRITKLLGISTVASASDRDAARQLTARYRFIRKLGQGGLGQVWLAHDENMQRYVALKEITDTQNTSRAALDRFRREAEITGRLEHPGIVPVYQLGEDTETGGAFYAMRFLGKQTLHDAISEYHERREDGDDDPMLLRHLLTAFVSICQAIGHAHSRKVIHRDLKPENIAIDSFGQVIVIDWGLAKVIDEFGLGDQMADAMTREDGDREQTMAGQVLGTPLYMAPEQAAGRIDELDERTDIYGLGAILFAILTGNAPHEQTRSSDSVSGTRDLISVVASEPTPEARAVNPDVDPALAAICARAMSKRPYRRYGTAGELAEDVQRWMAGEQASAYEETASQRVGRWIQHHRRLSQALGAALIVALVAGATLAISARQNDAAEAQVRFDELRGEEREIEVQLLSHAHDLGDDVRFMSTLPPIQGIVDSRNASPDDSSEVESEQVWRERLERIYEGLLRANSDYLAVSYIAANAEGTQEIVRVERRTSDSSDVRRVPKSRLANVEDDALVRDAILLGPGEVRLSIQNLASAGGRAHRRLVAAVPVYDEKTGAVFGTVTIESDLSTTILSILNGLSRRETEIFVAGADGNIWVTSQPGFGVELETQSVSASETITEAKTFFDGDRTRQLVDEAGQFIAKRINLDPGNPECSVAVVLQVPRGS